MNSTNPHYDRRVEHYRTSANRSFSRGFAVGFISCALIVCAFLYGQREAYANERPAPRAKHEVIFPPSGWPPHWRTWLRIGMCEQPKRGVSWMDVRTPWDRFRSIAWHQTYNWSFVGGMGFTAQNWRDFRPRSARHIARMSNATPAQQLWAAERIYQHFARNHSPAYASTVWDCSRIIGFRGFNTDGSWR